MYYVYTVRTMMFIFIILYNYENLNKGKKGFKQKKIPFSRNSSEIWVILQFLTRLVKTSKTS